jgi:hypothetical protein
MGRGYSDGGTPDQTGSWFEVGQGREPLREFLAVPIPVAGLALSHGSSSTPRRPSAAVDYVGDLATRGSEDDIGQGNSSIYSTTEVLR